MNYMDIVASISSDYTTHFVSSPVSDQMAVRVVSSGILRNIAYNCCKERIREDYLLLAVLNGTVRVRQEDRRRDLVPGDWVLFTRGLRHSYHSVGSGCAWVWVHFMGDLPVRLLDALGSFSADRFHFRQRNDESIRLVRQILACGRCVTAEEEIQRNTLLLQLLASLQRNYVWNEDFEERMQTVDRYIQEHLNGRIALVDLAAQAGMSRFHFLRVFRERFGHPPMKYVQKLRMQIAQALLRECSTLRIGEVAARLGFDDQLHFSRVFRQWSGVSPRAFRKEVLDRDTPHTMASLSER
jgi:AraC-like DNA-binding protein